MKFKALRTIKEPHDFVEICFHRSDADPNEGVWAVYTGELPNPQPITADLDLMKVYYSQQAADINLDDYELIEMECSEAGVIGADIRNKLTPPLNLIALLRIYFSETDDKDADLANKAKILPFVKKEMVKSEENIKYISNIL